MVRVEYRNQLLNLKRDFMSNNFLSENEKILSYYQNLYF